MSAQPPYYAQQPGPPPQPQKKGMSTCLIVALVLFAVGGVVVVLMVVLGAYGVQRYLSSAKSAEAKNTIGAISRAAAAAYERETLIGTRTVHRVCSSAAPVPAGGPPAAKKYMPNSAAGSDYNAGNENTGWVCLKFSMTMPQYYQYHYHAGSGYLVPTGAPGPNGFEAAAMGDLDGNGKFSKFARTAEVRGETVVMSTELYVENEFE